MLFDSDSVKALAKSSVIATVAYQNSFSKQPSIQVNLCFDKYKVSLSIKDINGLSTFLKCSFYKCLHVISLASYVKTRISIIVFYT